VDYQTAMNYFLKAAVMGDDRVTAEAEQAAEQLQALLDKAQKVNDAVIEQLQARIEY